MTPTDSGKDRATEIERAIREVPEQKLPKADHDGDQYLHPYVVFD